MQGDRRWARFTNAGCKKAMFKKEMFDRVMFRKELIKCDILLPPIFTKDV